MKLGNRGLLCDCENSLVEGAPYCADCFHKDPSVYLDPSVKIEPKTVINYITDPSNTYIGRNKVYEFPQKKYKMLPKEITKNKCNRNIEIDNRCKFNDPNMIYERKYYNPRYMKLKCGDNYNNIVNGNGKESFNNYLNFTPNNKLNNNILFVIIIVILLLFILLK
jgi:hypothetical protein